MKIKTACYIEITIRILLMILTFPIVLVGGFLLMLAKPFEWVIEQLSYIMDKFGHYLFLKSKMVEYVKNETYKRTLTAWKAYKVKRLILKEQPHLSENDF